MISFEISTELAVPPRTTGWPTERHAGFTRCRVANAHRGMPKQDADVLHPTVARPSGQKSRCHVGVQPHLLTEKTRGHRPSSLPWNEK